MVTSSQVKAAPAQAFISDSVARYKHSLHTFTVHEEGLIIICSFATSYDGIYQTQGN